MNLSRRIPILTLFLSIALLIASVPVQAANLPAQEGGGADVAGILDEIAAYDFGDSRAPLARFREVVQANLDSEPAKHEIEQQIIEFLKSGATFAGKQFVCEQLSIIGTAASVPVLSSMLSEQPLADVALFALQRIPDHAVDEALRSSLARSDRMSRIAIINTLGERRDPGSVDDLASLLDDADQQTALSAAVALGKIAGPAAAAVLGAARATTTGHLRGVVLDAYLVCADSFLNQGSAADAADIYRQLYEEESSTPVRAAALRGLVISDHADAVDTILAALHRDNQELQSVAVGLARGLPKTTDMTPIIDEMAGFSDESQIQLLSALGHRKDLAAHGAAMAATRHPDAEVRVAALSALAMIGNQADIDFLVHVAVSGQPVSNREAARASLDRLSEAGVDAQLIEKIPAANPEAKAEIVRSLGARNSTGAVDVLLTTAADQDAAVRAESFTALAIVAGPDHVEELIALLVHERNEGVRSDAEGTVVLVSQKMPPDDQARPVLAALAGVDDTDARSSLIEVLGRIGDTSALPALKTELTSDSPEYRRAAILALSVWPDAGPADDLLQVVRTSASDTERVLALRGFIDLTRIESDRPESESIERFQTAMSLATEASEKRMVLAGLGEVHTAEALRVTVPYLGDIDLEAEVEAALLRQIGSIRNTDDQDLRRLLDGGLREDLRRILEVSENERLLQWTTELLERGQ